MNQDGERENETAALPKGEPIEGINESAQLKSPQAARWSFKKAICAAMSVTSVVMVIGVAVPVLFFFLFVGEVSSVTHHS